MNQTVKDDIAGGLTKVLWTASQIDDMSDFEDLLEAIRVLRPGWKGASIIVAWRYVRRQEWLDGLRALEADGEATRSALHTALMAVCLFGMEDPLWHGYARTASEQQESTEASKIGSRLLERAARLEQRGSNQAAASAAGTHHVARPVTPAPATTSVDANIYAASSWVRA